MLLNKRSRSGVHGRAARPDVPQCGTLPVRMSDTQPPAADDEAALSPAFDLPRRIGFGGAVAVMVGVMIGSGIFNTPTVAAANIGRPWVILGMWALGGVLALFGALTYAELTTRHPRSGGMYVFLREGFGRAGPPLAFTFGWTYMLITKPFAAAGIMVPGAEHILLLAGYDRGDAGFETMKLVLTTGLLLGFTAVNVPGVKLGTGLAGALTGVKFGALAVLVLVAVALRKGAAANLAPAPAVLDTTALLAIATTMSAVLWTYDGWADVGSIAGEVKRPRRTLPLIFVAGVLTVMALYLAVNLVYMWMLPMREMAATGTVAPVVANRLLGATGGAVVTALVVVSTLGSSHASIITGARVTFAQARDGLLFRHLGRIHPRHQTPATALWVQCALSIAAVWWLRRFEDLAGGFVFTMWIFYGLAGVALILMRTKDKLSESTSGDGTSAEAFRCPGYPWVPLLFITSATSMTVLSIAGNPKHTLAWLAVLAAGAPMYYLWRLATRETA